MPTKVKHSTTIAGFYRTKDEATKVATRKRKLGLGARVKRGSYGKNRYAVYVHLKR